MKLGTLHYDFRTAEGFVKWNKDAVDLTQPNVVMLDSLGDWIAELTLTYNDLHAVTFPEDKPKDG